jgi:hypothetical protein
MAGPFTKGAAADFEDSECCDTKERDGMAGVNYFAEV